MWDDTYLTMLGTQDLRQLCELRVGSNPETGMGESVPVNESFKSSLCGRSVLPLC
jgi:hypothetical protein